MKYSIVIVTLLLAAVAVILGYFVINDQAKEGQTAYQPSDETPALKEEIAKLRNETAELTDNLAKQYTFIQKLSAQIAELEKKLQGLGKNFIGTNSSSGPRTGGTEQPLWLSDGSLNPILSGEIFKDPQFAKIFQAQVAEAIKAIQEEEQKKDLERLKEQLLQRLAEGIKGFAGKLNLPDYLQQELFKILSDTAGKLYDLSYRASNKDNKEDYWKKVEELKAEAREKVRQILPSEQYEEYRKSEVIFLGVFTRVSRMAPMDMEMPPGGWPR